MPVRGDGVHDAGMQREDVAEPGDPDGVQDAVRAGYQLERAPRVRRPLRLPTRAPRPAESRKPSPRRSAMMLTARRRKAAWTATSHQPCAANRNAVGNEYIVTTSRRPAPPTGSGFAGGRASDEVHVTTSSTLTETRQVRCRGVRLGGVRGRSRPRV